MEVMDQRVFTLDIAEILMSHHFPESLFKNSRERPMSNMGVVSGREQTENSIN